MNKTNQFKSGSARNCHSLKEVILVLIIVVVIFPLATAFSVDVKAQERNSLEAHLGEAERAFRKALELDRTDPENAREYYRKAILHYEYLVNEGRVRNGKLFYNIGNAYFRSGDIGRAILNYKRALIYIPDDENLKQNLEYARSRRKDRIEVSQSKKVYRTLFFLHYDIPSRVKLYLFLISFSLMWVLATVKIFLSSGQIKLAIIVLAIISAIFCTSLVVEDLGFAGRPQGVIVAEEVVARKGDAETYQRAFKEPLHAGTEFFLLETRGGWMHIELDNGVDCWIPPGAGEIVPLG